MAALIIEILPFAIGVFASPLPVIIAVVFLFSSRPRPTSTTYVVTWMLGLTAATVIFALLAGLIEDQDQPRGWVPWVRVALGVVLVLMALKVWAGRRTDTAPRWLSTIMDAGPREALRFGVLMSAANPKELLMALAAGLAVGTSDVGVAGSVGAIAVFVIVGATSVVAPLLVFLVGGDGTLERLATARQWLQRNNAAVAAVVLGLIGLFLLVGGLLKV